MNLSVKKSLDMDLEHLLLANQYVLPFHPVADTSEADDGGVV